MKKRVLFVLPILSIFLFSSVALSKNVREGLDKKENRASSKLEVLSPKKVIKPRVVKAMPVLQSAEEDIILEDLKEARLAGDRDAAKAIQSELDELHGILPNTPQPADDQQEEMIFEEPSQEPGFEWVTGDILVNYPSDDVVKPAMASAPNGDLYVATEHRNDDTLHIYKSTDDGATWSNFLTLYSLGNDNRNPSIAVTADWLFVAYEVWYSDTNRSVRVYSKPTDGSSGHGAWVVQNIADTPDFICPEICTDSLEFPGDPYVYVTYAVRTPYPWYYLVYFSRSEDDGVSFSTPVNVTGGTAYTAWATKPDIAYGQSGLFITFCKPGNTSAHGFVDEVVWVSKSTNFGGTWNTPVQLTDYKKSYHPRISAAHNSDDSVVVVYTYEYSSTDDDVMYYFSMDGGSTWNGEYSLAVSSLDENSAAISVSNYQGRFHAAYNYDAHNIRYRSADTATPTTWSSSQLINELAYASGTYLRPTITVNPTMPEANEACIAWTDYRTTWYDIYFDSAYLPLVVYGDELAGDFGSNGLWHYDGATWTKKTNWNPGGAGMAGWSGGLAADFDGNGLWNYDGISWKKITSWDVGNSAGMAGWAGGLAGDFGSNGLWNYNGTSWSKKTSWNADNDLVGWNGGLAVDFGANGLWNYDGSTWSKKTTWNAGAGGMAGWSGGLAVDFDGNGLWNYDGSSWKKKTSLNAGSGGMAGWSGGLAVDFDGNGLWNYDGSTWSKKTGLNPEGISALGDGFAADFGINGVWYYDGTTWSKKTSWDAENLTDVDLY